jgi:hypothetical protein
VDCTVVRVVVRLRTEGVGEDHADAVVAVVAEGAGRDLVDAKVLRSSHDTCCPDSSEPDVSVSVEVW